MLLHKIQHPECYLPATDVVARPSPDGSTYREMTVRGRRIVERIVADAALHEVRFVVVDSPLEHVNLVTTDAAGVRRLEFFQRASATGERVPWATPAAVARGGMAAVLADAAKADAAA